MVRSLWKAAVVVGLAWTGLAWAQSSTPTQPGASTPPERYITVREEGGTPQRCKLLKTWREPNGASAYEVQAVDTGEVMTIVEASQAGTSRGTRFLATRIFRWGRGAEPPADAPTPPPGAQVVGTPLPPAVTPRPRTNEPPAASQNTPLSIAPLPTAQTPSMPLMPDMPSAPPQPRTNATAGTPPPVTLQKTALSVVPAQKTAPALASQTFSTSAPTVPFSVDTGVGSSQPLTSAKKTSDSSTPVTLPVVVQKTNDSSTGSDSQPATMAQPRLTPTVNSAAGSPTPCNAGGQPSSVCCPPAPPRPSLMGRLLKSDATPTTTTVTTTVTSKPAPLAKTATEAAQPRDWRESWGKVEPWKNVAQAQANPPAVNPAAQPDPIKDPDWYRGVALKQSLPGKTVSTTKSTVVQETPSAQPDKPSLPPTAAVEVTRAPVPMLKAPTKGMKVAPPVNRRGEGIEMASDQSNAFWTPPPPPKVNGQEYNAFGPREGGTPPAMNGMPVMAGGPPMGPMPMAFPPPPLPPSPPVILNSGVPSGMGNAFTVTSTRRPIPADFGPPAQVPNAFRDESAEMQAQGMVSMPHPGMQPPGQGMPSMPMPGMPVMLPSSPMVAINPLMSVPPSPASAPATVSEPAMVPQALATLKDALCPSQREMAAEQLAEVDWHKEPHVVACLTRAAQEDPAASVRAACVRALAHMEANTAEVVAAVQSLKNDRDPQVRQEVEEALNTFGSAGTASGSGVRQASHR